jgi:hypothetical protein
MFGLAVGFGIGLLLEDANAVIVALGGNTSTLRWFALVVQWTMGVPLMLASGPWLYLVGLQERYYRPASIVDIPDEEKVLPESIGQNEDKTTR